MAVSILFRLGIFLKRGIEPQAATHSAKKVDIRTLDTKSVISKSCVGGEGELKRKSERPVSVFKWGGLIPKGYGYNVGSFNQAILS